MVRRANLKAKIVLSEVLAPMCGHPCKDQRTPLSSQQWFSCHQRDVITEHYGSSIMVAESYMFWCLISRRKFYAPGSSIPHAEITYVASASGQSFSKYNNQTCSRYAKELSLTRGILDLSNPFFAPAFPEEYSRS